MGCHTPESRARARVKYDAQRLMTVAGRTEVTSGKLGCDHPSESRRDIMIGVWVDHVYCFGS